MVGVWWERGGVTAPSPRGTVDKPQITYRAEQGESKDLIVFTSKLEGKF